MHSTQTSAAPPALSPLPFLAPSQALRQAFILPDEAAPNGAVEPFLDVGFGVGAVSLAAAAHHAAAGVSAPKPRRSAAAAAADENRRQGFKVGPLRLLMHSGQGSELTDIPAMSLLPNAPAWFCGMANLHGNPTPVFDLAQYCGLPSGSAAAKPMLLVLGQGAQAAGILIDDIPQRLHLDLSSRADAVALPERLQGCVTGAFLIEDTQWFDLAVAALLERIEHQLESAHH